MLLLEAGDRLFLFSQNRRNQGVVLLFLSPYQKEGIICSAGTWEMRFCSVLCLEVLESGISQGVHQLLHSNVVCCECEWPFLFLSVAFPSSEVQLSICWTRVWGGVFTHKTRISSGLSTNKEGGDLGPSLPSAYHSNINVELFQWNWNWSPVFSLPRWCPDHKDIILC